MTSKEKAFEAIDNFYSDWLEDYFARERNCMMNYDEAIKAFKELLETPDYECEAISGGIDEKLILIVSTALETAKKEHAELSAIKQRAEEMKNKYKSSAPIIDYIIKGVSK